MVTYLKSHGFPYAERRALAGAQDKGDISGVPMVCIEAKSHKTMDLAGWLDEATKEKMNANAAIGVVVFPRRNHSTSKAYCLMELSQFVEMIR